MAAASRALPSHLDRKVSGELDRTTLAERTPDLALYVLFRCRGEGHASLVLDSVPP